ncbi:MAG TPA: hypothetical protein VGH36_03600 [Acetobacteraceae bacterium]|jgi:hypothetical protein
MRRASFAALFALTPALFASSAQASVMDFSYRFADTGNVVSGAVDGNLLSDGNVFDLSSFVTLFVNGVSAAPPTSISSADAMYGVRSAPAAISLDGSYLNLYATDYPGTDALAFVVGNAAAADLGSNLAGASPVYGGTGFTNYVPGNWMASLESAPVPEPSSILLMLAPLALLASTWRIARRSVSRRSI